MIHGVTGCESYCLVFQVGMDCFRVGVVSFIRSGTVEGLCRDVFVLSKIDSVTPHWGITILHTDLYDQGMPGASQEVIPSWVI